MRRVLMMLALTLIVIGAMSQEVNSYYRPIVEGQEYANSTGDHPWGGDGSTAGGDSVPPHPTSLAAPVTGFGPVDFFLKLYYAKMLRYDTTSRTGRTVGTKSTTTTTVTTNAGSTTTTTTTTNTTGSVITGNE